MTEDDIITICDFYDIENYKINSDMSIDVDGNVDITTRGFHKIPLKFNRIEGSFDCGNNYLTNLENCPVYVGDDFSCNSNRLSNLDNAPKHIGRSFYCYKNNLTSLKGVPKIVNGDFSCWDNNLSSLEDGPKVIYGSFWFYDNPITTLQHFPKYIGNNVTCNEIDNAYEYRWLLLREITGRIDCSFPEIQTFLNNNKNPPKKDLPRLFSQLKKIDI